MDECLAIGIVHLTEKFLAEVVIFLDRFLLVDFFDDLLFIAYFFLKFLSVFLEGRVPGNAAEAFDSKWMFSYFLSTLRLTLLNLL